MASELSRLRNGVRVYVILFCVLPCDNPIAYPVPAKVFDLRVKTIPLHKRLSPGFAGLPGNDLADISLVCNEWIQKAATVMAAEGKTERLRYTITILALHWLKHLLSVRVGSFNVNGKLPSQDLSPWLQPSSELSWISPLKPLSPLELSSSPEGEITLANSLTHLS